MEPLNRDTCAFAKDGTCKFPASFCAECRIDKDTSDFHARLCIGSMTWDEVKDKQQAINRKTGQTAYGKGGAK